MLRSTLLALLMTAPLAATALEASARHVDSGKPTVILVHGAFADASSWDKVAMRLTRQGLPVVAVDNPLTSLEDDVAATRRAIDAAPGKVVLVGHSWGGTVITAAGDDPKVSALVYVAAFAPDVGQTSAQQGEHFPVAPGLQRLQEHDGYLSLSREAVASGFAQDLKPAVARRVFEHQLPLKAAALSNRSALPHGSRNRAGMWCPARTACCRHSCRQPPRRASALTRVRSRPVMCRPCRRHATSPMRSSKPAA